MIDSLSTATAAAETLPPATAQGPAPVAAPGASVADPADTGAGSQAAAASRAQPSTRLLVELDGGQGYVYRLVDTVTGRLLVELPRAQLEELKSHPAYTAGALLTRSV